LFCFAGQLDLTIGFPVARKGGKFEKKQVCQKEKQVPLIFATSLSWKKSAA
jgi:hypothetical protein